MATASKQAGFEKLRLCAKHALKEGLEFIWVDTCCIDKNSSAELSEAINSMFRWYRQAKACYAYLQDILDLESLEMVNGDVEIQSRWFKRAWTLQELLAPQRLVFYSSNWTNIRNRNGLLRVAVSRATGIEAEYLIGAPLEMASIAKRMSWAAHREATRAEDIAYSLFGLFDVQMPLLYSEGQRKAFRRLQEEIMKFSCDHTLFAWTKLSGVDLFTTPTPALALGPNCFADSGRLVHTDKISPLSPYSMTNIGLRISLPLSHDFNKPTKSKGLKQIFAQTPLVTPNKIEAVLNCHLEGDYFNLIALPLTHVSSNQFLRASGETARFFPVKSLSKYTMQEIFIRNEMASISRPSYHRRRAFIFRKLPDGAVVREVFPPHFWIPKEKIIQNLDQSDFSKSYLACMCPLRAHDRTSSKEFFPHFWGRFKLLLGFNQIISTRVGRGEFPDQHVVLYPHTRK